MRVAVIGAGIIGVSSAIAIQQKCPNIQVTIIAEKFSPHTTSDVAAGIIEPYLCGNDEDTITRWTQATINRIEDHMKDGLPGAQPMSGYCFKKDKEAPKWLKIMRNVKILDEYELAKVARRPEHKFGYFLSTWYLEPTAYINYCMGKFKEAGGLTVQRSLSSFTEISDDYDLIVNCSGLGSRLLASDDDVRPCRGQIMRAYCPAVKHFFIDDNYYTLLNDNCIIMGGTSDMDQWDTKVDENIAKKILIGNYHNLPSIKSAKILSHHVGLRPYRSKVRLELSNEKIGSKTVNVVHNYGHSGSGVTLHWGCALDVAELVGQYYNKTASSHL